MPSEGREVKRLLRQLYLLRLTLILSFIVAIGTTALLVAPTLFQSATQGALYPGAVTQTTFASTTAKATFTSTPPSQGGYGVISAPLSQLR